MSAMSADLLIELGGEELPPRALPGLSAAFTGGIVDGLAAAGLKHGAVQAFATPRRLAVLIEALPDRQPDQAIDRLGPAVAAAFDDAGKPKPAAEGFARSCGVTVDELERRETDKGERLAYSGTQPGTAVESLLQEILDASLKALPIPKRMRWGSGEDSFVRPVHWLVCLHGERVLPLECLGCNAGNRTRGHRFHHGEWIELTKADEYVARLRDPGHVIADFAERRQLIASGVDRILADDDATALVTDSLLDEVTALVEWPVPLSGGFDERFLVLPREAIVAVLEGHQRYFPVASGNGSLLPRFVTVANIDSREPDRVIAGNERVIRPRLADALFFWEQDLQRGLTTMATGLAAVSYERSLGSMAEKTQRNVAIAGEVAAYLKENVKDIELAAGLCKADLLSEMVGEFPELQGIMGGYYAEQAGLHDRAGQAIREHYQPVGAGAPVPASIGGAICALADKLDTLAGIFALGKRPTGDKDPFALRRAALGILRISVEAPLDIELGDWVERAVQLQPVSCDTQSVVQDIMDFFADRLRAWYLDKGVSAECFSAVLANGLSSPMDFDARITAVQRFSASAAATALCGAHKRVRNILKKQGADQHLDTSALQLPEERTLHQTLEQSAGRVETLSEARDYGAALDALAEFEGPVAAFFDNVMVMSEVPEERANRLALLDQLDRLCRSVADISRLSAE